jgi:ribosomal protein S18 acetylase RimI-like enzyme
VPYTSKAWLFGAALPKIIRLRYLICFSGSNHFFPMAPEFTVIELPRSYDVTTLKLLPTLIDRSKSLRLESLQTNPEAFSSTYEREVQFTDSIWADRLKNPVARTYIATDLRGVTVPLADDSQVSGGDGAEEEVPFDVAASAPWVGSTVLVGPKIVAGQLPTSGTTMYELTRNESMIQGPDSVEGGVQSRLYVINAVYVSPAGRGKGVGKILIEAAIRAAEEESVAAVEANGNGETLADCMCVMFVEKGNVAALRLYERCGFVKVTEDEYTALNGRKGVSIGMKRDIKLVRG